MDPRLYQIAFLAALLVFGVAARDFGISFISGGCVLGGALGAQGLAILLRGLPISSLLSAAISGLSLLLLCRSDSPFLLLIAALLAIGSKFLFRFRGKHFFNPTCFGIVALLYTGRVWVSPGQWGESPLLACWIFALGVAVVRRSRSDALTLCFLGAYLCLLAGRVLYLCQPTAVIWHQARSGSLLIFAFFMISDPRSTPNSSRARALFAAAVAGLAYHLRFHCYSPNALLLALFFLSPLTPFLDTLFKHSRYEWNESSFARSPCIGRALLRFLRFLRRESGREPL